MSPVLSLRSRQPLLPSRDRFFCWNRPRGAAAHRLQFLVVAGPAGRDNSQSPRMQESLQPPVTGWVVRGVHGLVVLAEELSAFVLWQMPENRLGGIRVLNLDRLSGPARSLHSG